ncbi:2'-5' RNA ligase family protein [Candidatus Uhrbacteria bacterium]|nr:MAG: 2'-5' RNA ligase family protein [Candidatus Uhrbacteria bacterium]
MKFLIAHVLTDDTGERVDDLRREISERFDVHGALRLPPHITFVTPFEHADADTVIESVRAAVEPFLPFTVRTTGFAAFGKGVWFIDMEQDTKLFDIKNAIQSELGPRTGWLPGIFDKESHFHLTIVYKDVEPAVHEKIGEFLKSRTVPISSITIDAMTVLRHEEKGWTSFRGLPFGT